MTEPGAPFDHESNSDAKPDEHAETVSSTDATLVPSDSAHAEAAADASQSNGSSNIMILWPDRSDFTARASEEHIEEPHPARSSARRRRRMALAAVAAIAALSGAAGGSLATLAIGQLGGSHAAPVVATDDSSPRVRDAIARITADVGALRVDIDRASHARTTQVTKLGERIDKVEKAQDDTSGRLAKLADVQERAQDKAQDRPRVATAASDITGSITPNTAVKGDPAKTDARKPPVVEGWTLTQVTNGGAIVSGPGGLYEAFPGDPLPGVGRVDAVRYQDGRWVVLTPKGIIIRR